jgi:MFS family permease
MARGRLVPELPRAAWTVLAGDALSATGSGLTLPFFVVYLERVRGIDLRLAGVALSIVAVASIPGNLVSGTLADRFGPRRTLMLGLVTTAAGTTWFAFVQSTWSAFAAAALIGFGNSIVWPAQDALLASAVPRETRPRAFGVRYATMNLGFSVGAVAAAAIADFSSPRTFELLYLGDAATFLAFVPILALLGGIGERPPAEDLTLAGGYRDALRDHAFLRVWLFGALLVLLGYAQYQASFAAYATGTGGLGSHALAVAFAVNTVAVVVFQLFVLRALEGRRRTTALALAFATWSATWALTIGAAQLGGGAAAVVGFACAMALFAVGETLASPTLAPIVNDLAPERLRGRYNGLYTLSLTAGFIAGPAAAGAGLSLGDGTPLFAALVVACGIGSLGALRLRRHLPPAVDGAGEEIAAAPGLGSVSSNS